MRSGVQIGTQSKAINTVRATLSLKLAQSFLAPQTKLYSPKVTVAGWQEGSTLAVAIVQGRKQSWDAWSGVFALPPQAKTRCNSGPALPEQLLLSL